MTTVAHFRTPALGVALPGTSYGCIWASRAMYKSHRYNAILQCWDARVLSYTRDLSTSLDAEVKWDHPSESNVRWGVPSGDLFPAHLGFVSKRTSSP